MSGGSSSSSAAATNGFIDPYGCETLKETKEYLQLSIMSRLKKLAMEVLRLQDVQESYDAMSQIVDKLRKGHDDIRTELVGVVGTLDENDGGQILEQFDELNECNELAKSLAQQFRNKMVAITEQIKEMDSVGLDIEGVTEKVITTVASITSEENYDFFFKQYKTIRDKNASVTKTIAAHKERKRKSDMAISSSSSSSNRAQKKRKDTTTDLSHEDDIRNHFLKETGEDNSKPHEDKGSDLQTFHANIYPPAASSAVRAVDRTEQEDVGRTGGGSEIKRLDEKIDSETESDSGDARSSSGVQAAPAPSRFKVSLSASLGTNLGTVTVHRDEQSFIKKTPLFLDASDEFLDYHFVPASREVGDEDISLEVVPNSGVIDLT